jgi:hypothetical protein
MNSLHLLDSIILYLRERPEQEVSLTTISESIFELKEMPRRIMHSLIEKLIDDGFVKENEHRMHTTIYFLYQITFDGIWACDSASHGNRPYKTMQEKERRKALWEKVKICGAIINAFAIIGLGILTYEAQRDSVEIQKQESNNEQMMVTLETIRRTIDSIQQQSADSSKLTIKNH